jgi:GMP synthase (glutamine-hydrolysing)
MSGWIKEYLDHALEEIRGIVGGGCALAAVSGGVDSTTAALLARQALGDRLHAVFIDTGFMREGEAVRVKRALESLLSLEILDRSEVFYKALRGLRDAEEKRRRFREVFYEVLSQEARRRGCAYLVQGTIAPDIIETKGGIKTQHNVLMQVGLNPLSRYGFKVLEPLRELYKDEVRVLADMLGLPPSITQRQPFPGPGLLVRIVGEVTGEKLGIVRRATSIVEDRLEGSGASQFFAAIWEDEAEEVGRHVWVYRGVRATGVRGDARRYGPIALYTGSWKTPGDLGRIVSELPRLPGDPVRLVAEIGSGSRGRYTVSIRAVVTEDFMTADVLEATRSDLEPLASEILGIPGVRRVVYDVTPKPPATIEYE